jgi:hypothetical protein
MRNIYAKRNPENLFTTIKHLRQGKNIKFSDLLKPKFSEKIPITGAHHDIRSAEIKNTVDNKTLKGYARDCPKPDSQPATFGNIYGEEAPRETAPRDFHRSVQPAAVEKTVDGDILTNIALTCENPDARPPEVGKIKKTTGYKNE